VVVDPVPGPRARILRRTNLQRFIDAKPADRYGELKYLIAVDMVEKSEKALSDAANHAANAANQFARDRESALELLEGIWKSEGSPGIDAIAWAESELARDQAGIEAQERAFANTSRALRSLLHAGQQYEAAIADRNAVADRIQVVMQELAETEGVGVEQSIALSRVLESVQKLFIGGQTGEACPVCEQPIGHEDLAKQVSARLKDLHAFRALDEQRVDWQQKQRSAEERREQSATRLVESANELVSIANGERPDSAPVEFLPENRVAIQPGDFEQAMRVGGNAENVLQDILDRRDDLTRRSGRVSALTQAIASIREAEQEADRAVQRQAALKKVLDIVRAKRHQFSRKLLHDVAEDTNRFYERIHPGEGLAISKLELDPKQRASLHQGVTFGGYSDVPPQAYFSEAHLDTLGFCFWLAVAKRDAQTKPLIVVIDDVFSSSDAQHLTRIVDLIDEEASSFAQVIVTTHHRSLRDRFRKTGKDQCLDLDSRWSLGRGIRIRKSTSLLGDLRVAVDADDFDRQAIASKAGIILEQMLDELALLYRLSLPRSEEAEYTLSDLLGSSRKLMKVLRVTQANSGEAMSPVPAFEAIDKMSFIRNQVGAHFNLIGLDVSDQEVEAFGQRTVELTDILCCSGCGQVPSTQDQTHYRCRCPKDSRATMTPLRF